MRSLRLSAAKASGTTGHCHWEEREFLLTTLLYTTLLVTRNASVSRSKCDESAAENSNRNRKSNYRKLTSIAR